MEWRVVCVGGWCHSLNPDGPAFIVAIVAAFHSHKALHKSRSRCCGMHPDCVELIREPPSEAAADGLCKLYLYSGRQEEC